MHIAIRSFLVLKQGIVAICHASGFLSEAGARCTRCVTTVVNCSEFRHAITIIINAVQDRNLQGFEDKVWNSITGDHGW